MKTTPGRLRDLLIPCVLIVAAGTLVYANTFSVPFLYDDKDAIIRNPTIRHLWPLWETLSPPKQITVSGRPILNLTLAVNYVMSGLEVWSYHVFNLVIHILAALALFGIVRRTLEMEALRERFGGVSSLLALAAALIWEVHPLQTESVTYVVQRAESLMGLFYLLTVYCAMRGFGSAAGGWWFAAATGFCAMGMGTKEVMVTTPVMVLLYDRVFISRGFRELFGRRWGFYAGLGATWLILLVLMLPGPRSRSAGLGFPYVGPIDYAMTQVWVIVMYYLRLAVWPDRLMLDYGWPRVTSLREIAFPAVILGGLLLGTIAALRRRPGLGFVGLWFFLILAPTSSFVPIADTAVEHRMYLPLAAVVVLFVVGGYLVGRRLLSDVGLAAPAVGWVSGLAVAVTAAVVLGYVTFQRNKDYRSEVAIWTDTVQKQPGNWRSHMNLGVALAGVGNHAEALVQYHEALRINPDQAEISNNLGMLLTKQGKLTEAISLFEGALRSDPENVAAHNNLGALLTREGKLPEATAHFREVLRLEPHNLGAHNNLGAVLARQGRLSEALAQYAEALKLDPYNLTMHENVLRLLARPGDAGDVIALHREALRLGIVGPYVLDGLARLLATHPDARYRNGAEAVQLARQAAQSTGYRVLRVLDTLGAAYAETGDFSEAARAVQRAVELASAQGQDEWVRVLQGRLALYRAGRPLRERPEEAKPFQPEGVRR